MKFLIALAMCAVVFGAGACACPKCAIDTVDGVGVSEIVEPGGSDRGALASVAQLLYAAGGVERQEVRAVDSAISSDLLVMGFFIVSPRAPDIRGYALMKDGRVCFDIRLVRAAPPDNSYLTHSRVWPLIPFLFAAGHRLVHGGAWEDSVDVARGFAVETAAALEAGTAAAALPPGADASEMASYLRRWSQLR